MKLDVIRVSINVREAVYTNGKLTPKDHNFTNLKTAGTFVKELQRSKTYMACYVVLKEDSVNVPRYRR